MLVHQTLIGIRFQQIFFTYTLLTSRFSLFIGKVNERPVFGSFLKEALLFLKVNTPSPTLADELFGSTYKILCFERKFRLHLGSGGISSFKPKG